MINGLARNQAAVNAHHSFGVVEPPVPYAAPPRISALLFAAYVDGAENSLPDYGVHLSTFQCTRRHSSRSYYSIVSPFSQALIDAISARPDGQFIIQQWPVFTDGTHGDRVAFESFNVGSARPSIGPSSASVVVTGTRQKTYSAPLTHFIDASDIHAWEEDSSQDMVMDVTPRYAASINPNDTIIWGGKIIHVREIRIDAGHGSFRARIVGAVA